jgi:hypothetical protein
MRASEFFHVVVVCAALTILQCGNCYGQATSGVVTGLVTDPSGAAVLGAEVTVTVVSSGVTFRAVTNDLGSYTVAYLPAAQCTVRVEKVGFKIFLRENVLVTVGSTIQVDVPLEVGSVSEQ